jgi:hypothetical protein
LPQPEAWQCSSVTTATLDYANQRIGAQRGIGSVHLGWSLRCLPMPGPVSATVPYELKGAVSLDTGRGPLYLTQCWSERPLWLRDGHGANVTVGMDLRSEQIEEIEDLRTGGDLTVLIDFIVTAIADGSVDTPVLDGNQTRLPVQAAAWVDVLQQLGIAERMLLVVPAPPATAPRERHEAWKAWQAAREAVDSGRWSDAVGATRKVYELLHVTDDPGTAPRERSKEERWQSVGAALYRLACAPMHADAVTLDMKWTRDDAAPAVAGAGAVLRVALTAIKP